MANMTATVSILRQEMGKMSLLDSRLRFLHGFDQLFWVAVVEETFDPAVIATAT
jgi:hypothetical protein